MSGITDTRGAAFCCPGSPTHRVIPGDVNGREHSAHNRLAVEPTVASIVDSVEPAPAHPFWQTTPCPPWYTDAYCDRSFY